jgi:proliferating cell nuclear antigen
MFEARLVEGNIFKQVIDSIKDLVQDTNVECSEEELTIQSMDSAHVALVAVSLSATAFEHYRCDRNLSLGINTASMGKILKMMNKKDILVLKAEDQGDALTMMFESSEAETIADFGTYRVVVNDRVYRLVATTGSRKLTHNSLCLTL